MREKYPCKYCGMKTLNKGGVCSPCLAKIKLWRQIQAMLMPYKRRKEEREKRNGNQR